MRNFDDVERLGQKGRKILMMLAEPEPTHRVTFTDHERGGQRASRSREINPNGMIQALVDPGDDIYPAPLSFARQVVGQGAARPLSEGAGGS